MPRLVVALLAAVAPFAAGFQPVHPRAIAKRAPVFSRASVSLEAAPSQFLVALTGDQAALGDPIEIALALGSVGLLVFIIGSVLFLEYDEKVATPQAADKPRLPTMAELDEDAVGLPDQGGGGTNRNGRRVANQMKKGKKMLLGSKDRPLG
ncbi:hypothetical protein M885DRAFT_169192 [Pelagophyceae sp. CCMP2097]|nr:hypothetical protein M885DRAFT_169192 [Pelagophyceae sp. CCMP2097]